MEYEIVTGTEVVSIAEGLIFVTANAHDPLTFMAVSVIGGDRATCCDEAVVAYDGGVPVGMATIAPKGESYAGAPEIVGVFVGLAHRRIGVGQELFLRAVARCHERGLVPLEVRILSRGMSTLVKKLPPDVLVDVNIIDQSHLSPF